jgi:hypothetical protein
VFAPDLWVLEFNEIMRGSIPGLEMAFTCRPSVNDCRLLRTITKIGLSRFTVIIMSRFYNP